jgi:hypothetical protein
MALQFHEWLCLCVLTILGEKDIPFVQMSGLHQVLKIPYRWQRSGLRVAATLISSATSENGCFGQLDWFILETMFPDCIFGPTLKTE